MKKYRYFLVWLAILACHKSLLFASTEQWCVNGLDTA